MRDQVIAVVRELVTLTLWGWLALELALLVRDGVRGNGSTTRDQGTRRLIVLAWIAAFAAAEMVAGRLRPAISWQLGREHLIAGLFFMWAGLAVRIWALPDAERLVPATDRKICIRPQFAGRAMRARSLVWFTSDSSVPIIQGG